MNLRTDYPFVIASYLLGGLLFHNVTDSRQFMPDKYAFGGITWYSIFVAVGLYLALQHISRCPLPFLPLVFVFVLPTMVRYAMCQTCSETYNVTMVYLCTIPLLFLFFDCSQIAVICTALAIGSSFGRLGCITAGCCGGPSTSCHLFHYKYHDKTQQPNTETNSQSTCTVPTIIFEAAAQFIITGLCLRYPRYGRMIFGIGTSIIVFVTGFWRKRIWPNLAAVVLLASPMLCPLVATGLCPFPTPPRRKLNAFIAVMTAYILSHDWFKPAIQLS